MLLKHVLASRPPSLLQDQGINNDLPHFLQHTSDTQRTKYWTVITYRDEMSLIGCAWTLQKGNHNWCFRKWGENDQVSIYFWTFRERPFNSDSGIYDRARLSSSARVQLSSDNLSAEHQGLDYIFPSQLRFSPSVGRGIPIFLIPNLTLLEGRGVGDIQELEYFF